MKISKKYQKAARKLGEAVGAFIDAVIEENPTVYVAIRTPDKCVIEVVNIFDNSPWVTEMLSWKKDEPGRVSHYEGKRVLDLVICHSQAEADEVISEWKAEGRQKDMFPCQRVFIDSLRFCPPTGYIMCSCKLAGVHVRLDKRQVCVESECLLACRSHCSYLRSKK
jgi:hypothetical protein